MKQDVTFNSTALKNILAQAGRIVKTNSVLAVLECIKVSVSNAQATLCFTDLETTIEAKIECQSISEPFTFAVSYAELSAILKELPECPITMTYDDGSLSLHTQTPIGKSVIGCVRHDDFPKRHELDTASIPFTLDSKALAKLAIAEKFVSTDTLRPQMTGVCFHILKGGKLRLVATDAHSLYKSSEVADTGIKDGNMFVIPSSGVRAIIGMNFTGDVSVRYNHSNITFETDKTLINVRLVDAKFPDYMNVIPDHTKGFSIETAPFIHTMKFVALSANKTNNQITFLLKDDKLIIKAQDIDLSKEGTSEPIETIDKTVEDFKFAFNHKIISKILSCMGEHTRFLNDGFPTKAFLLQDREDEDTFLIMPLMIGA